MGPIKKVGIPAHLKCCVAAPKTTENLSARDEVGAGGFSRELWLNEPERSAASRYPLNRTSTTKYTLLTFFPKGLYEQFRRLANLYFLFSAAISLTPLTPYSPVTVILPLIFVIGVSLIKEAIEDWRRHGADVEINNRKVLRHSGGGQLESVRWRDLRVGDVVKVEKDAFFPADLLFLSSSSEEASCYVETMNLDGETNLKVRRALEQTLQVHSDLASFKDAHIKCEDPNPSLYTFVGTLEWKEQTTSIPPASILLRDSKLRNTEWVVGAVIFAGHDTKVMQNATDPPSKRSSLERQMDKIILALFAWLFVMAFITGLVYGLLTKRAMPGAFYLGPFQHEVYWDPDRAAVSGITQFVTAFILYGYLIPISLYVTVEIVKVIQAFNISQDRTMYYPETDQPTNCRTSNLNEELGQIDTILTDKTGTLTCNQMEFFKCSIAGVTYGTGQTEVEKAAIKRLKAEGRWHGDEESGGAGELSPTSSPASNGAPPPPLSIGEIEAGPTDAGSDGRGNLPGAISSPKGSANGSVGAPRPLSPSSGTVSSPVRSPRAKRKGFNLVDERLQGGHWLEEADPGTLRMFFRVLAVCHTAIPEGEPTRDKIIYQVESPDEGALVEAAAAFGFFFYRRTSSAVFVSEPSESEDGKEVECKYEILNLLEFDSTRKRMSVIVKDPAGKILLLTKGADNVIYERLGSSGRQYAAATKEHLEQYSQAGLRTLCFGFRVLDPAEYKAWSKTYDAAKAIVGPDRGQKVDEAAEEIERDLTLLGCSGVEDKLQAGVPETIDKLAKAGLKIWVLTGDKVETAINIGYACSLLRQGMDRILVTLDRPEVAAADEAGDKDKLFEVSMRLTVEQLEAGLARIAALRKKETENPDAAPGVFALVIDGKSLTFALDAQNKDKFLELAQACAAVIACRVSPKQKALVTYLVKEALGKICLGIGDGANDVGMINAADIGVGISGFEGTQAVMASDFAIGQFRFLERLLLVHGRWCYRRIALMISYFFYKNVTFGLTLFFFSRYAFFSVQPIYDDWYLTFYNLIFTSLPVIAVGVLDQDVGAATSLAFPALYLQGQSNSYFSWSKISAWMLNGIYASLINYYLIIQGCTNQAFARNGRSLGMYDIGTTMYTSILWTVTFQMCVAIGYWTWIHHLFIWGSMALWYLFCLAYNALPTNISPNVHKTLVERLAPAPAFWLLCLLVPTVAVLPDFIYRCGQRLLKPLDVHIVQEVEKSELFKRDPAAWQAMAAHAQKDTGVGFSRAVDDMVAGVTKLPKRVLGLVRKKKGARKRQPAAGASLEMPPSEARHPV